MNELKMRRLLRKNERTQQILVDMLVASMSMTCGALKQFVDAEDRERARRRKLMAGSVEKGGV